jgi:GNAT superfamily N-acetyltransferase
VRSIQRPFQLYAKTLVLCLARIDGDLAALGAIKRPFHDHRERVFAAARCKETPAAFTYELGWFHVLEKYRGNKIASRMVAQLMPWAAGATLYATSRINNLAMNAALTKHGGCRRRLGTTFRQNAK